MHAPAQLQRSSRRPAHLAVVDGDARRLNGALGLAIAVGQNAWGGVRVKDWCGRDGERDHRWPGSTPVRLLGSVMEQLTPFSSREAG